MLATGNRLPAFWIIDLACGAGYLRDISPHLRTPLARKILLADDSVTAQNMGRKILADAGYEVITVNNGSAALKRINEQRPDLVVLDVYMPGYSGLEVCQRLKEAGDTSRIPILLTVGKLEPFKPEEAKRVRADGFIVKPFEASELLSALSKLEDKIVPRAETSKPGRLARAAAALDEAPRDKTVPGGEDSSWKNRIAFPSKKEKTAEAEADDSAIYNPVNKDLRTVIESRTAGAKQAEPKAHEEEERVDLGALAPEGLPKDVTPEEIAALASAAAQIQGKVLESKAEQATESTAEQAQNQAKAEMKPEAEKEEVREPQASDPIAEPVIAASVAPSLIEAVQERLEAPASTSVEAVATVGDIGHESAKPQETDSAREFSHDSSVPADVPVTMAVATGSDSGKSHWTAVAVALAPEENGLALEEELRKASAVATIEAPAAEAVHSTPVAEAAASVSELPAPEPEAPAALEATTSSESAAVANDTVRAAVKQFETVASAHVPEAEAAKAFSSLSPSASSVAEEPISEPGQAVEKEPVPGVAVITENTGEVEAEAQQPVPENFKAEHEDSMSEPVPAPAELATLVAQAVSEPEPPAQSSTSNDAKVSHGSHERDGDNLSATTAAAWASWQRVRETNTPPDSPDTAAMAVAAGAEKTPEEALVDYGSDPAIASIVDSVLADLRPKIVEEISRKLGKKK
jgi:CheY-like chemotaxis protein